MTKWLAMLMACLALGLVAAGCGDDDEDDGGGSADTTEAPAAPAGGGGGGGTKAGGKTVEVHMKNIQFDPATVTVTKGSTVDWINDDTVGHDVTKTGGPGPDFKSGDPGGLNQGDSFKETFNTAGTIKYVCTVHNGMEGTIVVK
jgi:plastocyanin